MSKEEEGFDLNKSRLSDDTLEKFLKASLNRDVTAVPGVGPANATILSEHNIYSAVQLLGQFMLLKEPGMSMGKHCDKMWFWLKSIGVTASRNNIVHAISEKAHVLLPELAEE
jgi:Barrier to autointegration factor